MILLWIAAANPGCCFSGRNSAQTRHDGSNRDADPAEWVDVAAYWRELAHGVRLFLLAAAASSLGERSALGAA
jgi:hypothetical protein